MKVRVVADSSANLFQVEGVDFVAAPLKIFTDNKEYIDDENLGENIVAQEFQKGYMYRDTVVRHSMVQVAN